MIQRNLMRGGDRRVNRGAGGGRGESPSEQSHSAVEVSAIVRGSRVPAEGADKVPAKERCSSTVQANLTRGKREEEGSPNNREVRTRRTETGHSFSNADRTDPATQERVQYQRAGPPGQLLHGWSETSDRVLTEEGGSPTVQNAKQSASRSAG